MLEERFIQFGGLDRANFGRCKTGGVGLTGDQMRDTRLIQGCTLLDNEDEKMNTRIQVNKSATKGQQFRTRLNSLKCHIEYYEVGMYSNLEEAQ